jgi:NodT family efflux transporter outer membrane factor (OMF) lipoprotein
MRFLKILVTVSPVMWLTGCDLAPVYNPPTTEIPAKFKESGTRIWQSAHPSDAEPHGEWWQCFNDRLLNELEPQVEISNQDLAAALAVYDQAQADVAKAQSGLFPVINNNDHFTTNKQSANRPLRSAGQPNHYGDNGLEIEASYEIDLWGRVRDSVAARQAQRQASAATLEGVKLSLQAELARDYVSLRGLDRQTRLLRDTVAAYKQALALTRERVAGKIAAPIDVARAEVQLDSAQAQLADIAGARALYEHAIATLTGKPASSFSIPSVTTAPHIPNFPAGVPSELLERRPDIAAAERQTAAANESIGVAKAAFFPRFTLNLAGGTQDTGLNLLSLPNSFWSVGPTVYLPLFDGGLRLAELTAAQAAYREDVARYRGRVLAAIQEVEDNLAVLRALKNEAHSAESAASAAQHAQDLASALYRDGGINFLDVVVAQTAALAARQTELAVETRRLQTSVALILALGGDYSFKAEAIAANPLMVDFQIPPR